MANTQVFFRCSYRAGFGHIAKFAAYPLLHPVCCGYRMEPCTEKQYESEVQYHKKMADRSEKDKD